MNDVYSVWNWKKGRYDYYRSQLPRAYRARIGYPKASGLKGLGEVPEQSVHPLPAGAKYTGEGDEAIGTVAQPRQRSVGLFVVATLLGLWALRGNK